MTGSQGPDAQLWAAMAEPSRVRVLDLLLGRGSATPTMLAQELPMTRQAVTKHLAVLDRAGLVEGHRQGREVRYVIDTERMAVAARTMTELAGQWDRRLHAIKQIAESVHSERRKRP